MRMKLLRSLSLVMIMAMCLGMLVGIGGVSAAENNYVAVTERATYASGLNMVFDAGIQLQGGHNHPTQTLTDLLTINREKGRFENLKIGFCGDLKFGRTVHSLINAMSRYEGNTIYLVSPTELKLPDYVKKDVLDKKNISYVETQSLEDVMPELDILYMTRVQRERFFNEEEYLRLRDRYILVPEKLLSAKEDLIIMHPLPRVNEISVAVDDDSRACYFRQALYGKYIRMALILKLLKEAGTI